MLLQVLFVQGDEKHVGEMSTFTENGLGRETQQMLMATNVKQ